MKQTFVLIMGLSYSISGISQNSFDLNHSNFQSSIGIDFEASEIEENLFAPFPTAETSTEDLLLQKQSSCLESPEFDLMEINLSQPLENNQFQLNTETEGFFRNRRNTYSSMWAFASLNYLYADLVGLMDHNMLSQYLTGTVGNLEVTPGFLTGAAAFMQIPIANVFLPQVIKNDRALRWVQIISGSVMTLVQGSTLFVGKPAPYYVLFSAFEMAATTFITIDAIKWKPQKKNVINTHL